MQPRCHIALSRTETFATLATLHEAARLLTDGADAPGLPDLRDVTALLIGKLYPEDDHGG